MATATEILFFAKQRHQAGDLAGADHLYRQVLQAEPARAEALALLALTCHQRGDLSEAENWYRRALALRPGDAEAHLRLGMVLTSLSRPADAVIHFREAVRLRPDSPEAWNNLGNIAFLQADPKEAVRCYREAVRLRPGYAEACLNLGNALREQDQVKEGLKWYREAVRLRPDYPKSRINLAAALLESGAVDEGETHLRACLKYNPRSAKALSTLMANDLYNADDPGPDEIRTLLASPGHSAMDSAHLHFTLARLLDKAGQSDEAFQHFKETNRIRHEQTLQTGEAYIAADHSRFVDRLIAFFTPEWFERVRGLGVDTEEPVFVIGMPRSGSSLVEQILTSHPDIAGVGELRDLPYTVDSLPKRLGTKETYPGCLSLLDQQGIRELGNEYLARVRDLAGPARRITDKMLVNFLHLGFITLLFPRARVINCLRDPLDTCVSCFMQIFRGLSFTLTLEDLGHYHREYERLMAHWRKALPLPMLEVVYEELVEDLDGGSKRLIDFCGLPWDDRCLRFYENPRSVRTVSKMQVRRPLYRSALGRWRRYASHLAPLRKALGLPEAEGAVDNAS